MRGAILPGSSVHKLLTAVVLPCGCDPLVACRVVYVEARARVTHACPHAGRVYEIRRGADGHPVVVVVQ